MLSININMQIFVNGGNQQFFRYQPTVILQNRSYHRSLFLQSTFPQNIQSPLYSLYDLNCSWHPIKVFSPANNTGWLGYATKGQFQQYHRSQSSSITSVLKQHLVCHRHLSTVSVWLGLLQHSRSRPQLLVKPHFCQNGKVPEVDYSRALRLVLIQLSGR